MVKRYVKRCPPSLIVREKQIKTIKKYHLTPVTVTAKKRQETKRAGEGVEHGEPPRTVHGTEVGAAVTLLPSNFCSFLCIFPEVLNINTKKATIYV